MPFASLRPEPDFSRLSLESDAGLIAHLGLPRLEVGRIDVHGTPEAVGTALSFADGDVSVEWAATRIGDRDVWECGARITAHRAVTLTRIDALRLSLDTDDAGQWRLLAYRSAWGDEFRPVDAGTTRHDTVIESRSGRSSHGWAPWLGAVAERSECAVIVSPAWSGNWHIRCDSRATMSAGVSPWQLGVELAPGEQLEIPPVVIATGRDLDAAAAELQMAVRDAWLPRTPFSDSLPVEWNHWWPYEDAEIDETVIASNAAVAHTLGFNVVTVDAGWFGAADAGSDWQEQRGDWDRVNTARFPSGLQALGTSIRAAGVEAGMWIEAEAVGRSSLLRRAHPEVLALTTTHQRHDPSYSVGTVSLDPADPSFLGYVCLGSPAGRNHVLESMIRLVTETGARWLKLDFNIDPDAGCTRDDHGHSSGDGLLRHYQGLYALLDEFRRRHPAVLLESCSSGGLRVDLGLARHVHGFFLSDPDYTEHHLEVLFGASRMLPPLGILHWSHSQWRGDYPPQQRDWTTLTTTEFDVMVRAAMFHRFGVSLRLTELRADLRDRLAWHVELYTSLFARFVRDGVLTPLTAPPLRGGLGERHPSLQLSVDGAHLVGAFALDGSGECVARVRGLAADHDYDVTDLGAGRTWRARGGDLAAGHLRSRADSTASSWLWHIVEAPEATHA